MVSLEECKVHQWLLTQLEEDWPCCFPKAGWYEVERRLEAWEVRGLAF
jgi:hypothetical protein